MGFILWPAPLTWPFFINKEIFVDDFWNCGTTHRRLKGGGTRGAMPPPKRLTKMTKWPNLHHFASFQNNFSPRHVPIPPLNLLIYSVILVLAATGPLQCERLEPPVAPPLTWLFLSQWKNLYKSQWTCLVEKRISTWCRSIVFLLMSAFATKKKTHSLMSVKKTNLGPLFPH